jgi:hypothetical protein
MAPEPGNGTVIAHGAESDFFFFFFFFLDGSTVQCGPSSP